MILLPSSSELDAILSDSLGCIVGFDQQEVNRFDCYSTDGKAIIMLVR